MDDFLLGKKHNLELPMTINESGIYYDHIPVFAGKHIFKVDQDVCDEIKKCSNLISQGQLIHSYPHSWRSKAPLVYKNTSQWFISMETNDLRKKALKSIDETDFYPKQGQNRLRSMIQDRPDWCVSRQRVWGVPLPIFVNKETGEPLRDLNVIERIAKIYEDKKVTCLSVLTEEDYFLGNLEHISKIKDKIKLPILCKDFFIDKFQVPLAKSYGADAILIILAGVSDDLANELYDEALKFKMSIIVEVHTVEEAKKALNFKEALIGINNRNLKTLKTDINTTYDIYDILKNHDEPLISESGIKTKDELLELKNKTSINTFLIGESLLKNLEKNSIFSVL